MKKTSTCRKKNKKTTTENDSSYVSTDSGSSWYFVLDFFQQ